MTVYLRLYLRWFLCSIDSLFTFVFTMVSVFEGLFTFVFTMVSVFDGLFTFVFTMVSV